MMIKMIKAVRAMRNMSTMRTIRIKSIIGTIRKGAIMRRTGKW